MNFLLQYFPFEQYPSLFSMDLKPFSYYAIIFTILVLTLPITCKRLYKLYFQFYYTEGIPVFHGLPFIGVTKLLFFFEKSFSSHFDVLEMVREKGPLSQFYMLGQHIFLITDGYLAKLAMENITGKGLFHVSH